MAMYTMELRTLINEYGYRLFDDYAFYTDDAKAKEDFEQLFIETYYFHEIGFETPDRFKWMLKAKLNRIMPYYSQLYLTEWNRVGKDMMTSKELVETTTHTLSSHLLGSQEQQASSNSNSQNIASGTESSEANSQTSSTGEESSEATSHSSGSGEGTNTSTELESALENGVPQVHLESDLTRKTQTNSTSSTSSEASSESDSTSTSSTEASSQSDSTSKSSTQASASSHALNESSLTNQQQNQLEEKTTFTSKGDIGIQTPAYAITEWRKVIININDMILNECEDLFMKIY